jgi:hypothetical protein
MNGISKVRNLSILIFSILLCTNISAYESIWVAGSTSQEVITSYKVKKFAMALELSDDAMATLFKNSSNDYSQYQAKVSKWLKPRFNKILRTILYTEIIKENALRKFNNKKFFTFTKQDYQRAIDKAEESLLAKLLKEGKGISKARAAYGQFLIDKSFPHLKSESASEVYLRWFKLTKARIKIEMLLKEVKKYESSMALTYAKDLSNSGTLGLAIWDYYDNTKKIIPTINNKKMSHKSLVEFLDSNNSIKILAKDINYYSLLNTDLITLKTKRNDITKIENNFLKTINSNEFITKLNSYINKIESLRSLTKKELNSKKEEAISLYIKTSQDKYLMLTHLYNLSISNQNLEISSLLKNAISSINKEFTTSAEKLTFIQLIEKSVHKVAIKDSPLQAMIHFMIKFEAKKISFLDKGLVEILLRDYNDSKTYNLIKNTISQENLTIGLKKFRNSLKRSSHIGLSVKLKDQKTLRNQEAINFVIGAN